MPGQPNLHVYMKLVTEIDASHGPVLRIACLAAVSAHYTSMHAAVKMLASRIDALRSLLQASQDGGCTPHPTLLPSCTLPNHHHGTCPISYSCGPFTPAMCDTGQHLGGRYNALIVSWGWE